MILSFFVAHAFASQRTFTAINEKAQVSLEQLAGKPNQYYLQVDGLDSPTAGQVMIVKHETNGTGSEDFRLPKCDCFVRLGGMVANSYSKPPVAGILTFQNRDIKLTSDDRKIDLKSGYAKQECLSASKEEAEKALAEASKAVTDACGTNVKVTTNWSSFGSNAGLARNGREALLGLADVCKDDDYKKAASAIQSFTITKGEGEMLKKSGSNVTYSVHAFPENPRFNARVYLEDNL